MMVSFKVLVGSFMYRHIMFLCLLLDYATVAISSKMKPFSVSTSQEDFIVYTENDPLWKLIYCKWG